MKKERSIIFCSEEVEYDPNITLLKNKRFYQIENNPKEYMEMKKKIERKEKAKQSYLLRKDFKKKNTHNETMEIGKYKPHWLIPFLSTIAFFSATTSLALTIISMC